MNAGARVAAFVALLAVIFAGAALAGAAVDPESGDEHRAASAHDESATDDEQTTGHGASTTTDATPAGVASAQDGLRLVAERTHFPAGRSARLRFRIVGDDGATVRGFETEQTRRMHLIVVRRDLRRYQHLHPVQGADGAWSVPLTLPDAGVYRAFTDFRRDGTRHTLGVDLFVAGDFEPLQLPPEERVAHTDGYDLLMVAQNESILYFTVTRRAETIVPQPYLGALGHLVVLREGDLAYRHVHPVQRGMGFDIGPPEPGTYRLFLQFRHGGRVHTAAFTQVIAP